MSKVSPAFRVTWFDRVLQHIFPRWGMRRVSARFTTARLMRHFEAAASVPRTDGWRRPNSDANTALARDLVTLRNLSRNLRRNNGIARRAVQVIAGNTVGWGIKATASSRAKKVAQDATDLWNDWADSVRCDYDGVVNFYGLQRLVMETVIESGEALVTWEPAKDADGLPVPLRIRVLEPDYLDHSKDGISGDGGGPIIQGVELDGTGRRVAYWLYEHHPGGAVAGQTFESRRVPAKDVLHIFRVERPGQIRGVPWMSSIITRLHDYDAYEDAVLVQQQMAASLAGFVTGHEGAARAIGENSGDETDDGRPIIDLRPGTFARLSPGEEVNFANPPALADQGGFAARNLRWIASGMGITYEELASDWEKSSFSASRQSMRSHWRNVYDWQWNMLIPQLCQGVWDWVMTHAAKENGWKAVPKAVWGPPAMPMIEPDKEGLAYSRLVRNGVMTYYEMLREQGKDPAAHIEEQKAVNKALDDADLVLDCDPRRVSSTGQGQKLDAGESDGSPLPAD